MDVDQVAPSGHGNASVLATQSPARPVQTAASDSSASTDGAPAATPAAEAASLKASAAKFNQNAQPQFGSIEFSVDQQSNKMVLKVVDQETNQVLLQIPSKEALALSRSIGSSGSLINASA